MIDSPDNLYAGLFGKGMKEEISVKRDTVYHHLGAKVKSYFYLKIGNMKESLSILQSNLE